MQELDEEMKAEVNRILTSMSKIFSIKISEIDNAQAKLLELKNYMQSCIDSIAKTVGEETTVQSTEPIFMMSDKVGETLEELEDSIGFLSGRIIEKRKGGVILFSKKINIGSDGG